MNDNFIERLLYFMDKSSINDNQMTVNAGLSVGLVGKMRKGITKSINSSNIERILYAYPNLSAHWLLTGEGEMLTTSANSTLQSNNSASFTELLAMINDLQKRNESLSMQLGAAQERIRQLEETKGVESVHAEELAPAAVG